MRIPSKKISVVFLVTTIIVVLIVLISRNMESGFSEKTGAKPVTSLSIDLDTKLQEDTDADGLLDWEESLWGSDPNLADTDGDKTNDGEEVKLNRNPAKAGPDDENISIEQRILNKIENSPLQSTGLTKEFSDAFMQEYFSLKNETGSDLSVQQKKDFILKVSSEAINSKKIKNRYEQSTLFTFDDLLDRNGILQYANRIIKIESDARSSYEQSGVSDINAQFEAIEKISIALIETKTPAKMAEIQTRLANNYYNTAISLIWLDAESDPLLQLLGLSLYYKSAEIIQDDWSNILQYLKNNGIIFNGETFIMSDGY